MTKARVLADFISDGSPLADGTISVSEVSGAAPLANPTFTGTVTSTGDVVLGDSDKAIFGAGSDLEIYHDGSNSYIDEVGAGVLKVRSNGTGIDFESTGGETLAQFVTNGAVTLYHNNSDKLATTSTGVDITGKTTTDELDLSPIASTIADTAVDVFVYDTSKDSDGGAWRKRTQGTSWYNETLNTATRGSRKEFPSVAVIVAENNQVTIYDGDDPSLPMWMVFNEGVSWGSGTAYYFGSTGEMSSVTALNGIISVGKTASSNQFDALTLIQFVSDNGRQFTSVGTNTSGGTFANNIANRNTNQRNPVGNTEIISGIVNDVAMTVLPNAPIDAATGLPVPTIAVGTDGGTSVIKDDGTVVDITRASNAQISSVDFYSGYLVIGSSNVGAVWYYDYIPSSDEAVTPNDGHIEYYDSGFANAFTPAYLGYTNTVTAGSYIGSTGNNDFGLTAVDFNPEAYRKSSTAFITSDFNTGWMNGDIKLATLSDTDDTDVTGSELVTNGTFDSDVSGWTASNATLSVVSSTLKVADNGSNSTGYQAITTVVGKTYTISLDIVEVSGNTARVYVSSTQPTSGYLGTRLINTSTLGSYGLTFVADSTTTYLQLCSEGTAFVRYDNISVRLAEEDRSVNGNGLQVFGTVTKNPVATGADLVAYSGFSSGVITGSRLKQPYNSDLNFGTGDFAYLFWVKGSASDNQTILDHANSNNGTSNPRLRIHAFSSSTGIVRVYIADGSVTNLELPSSVAVLNNTWNCLCVVRRSGVVYIYVNGELDVSNAYAGNLTRTAGQLSLGVDGDGTDPLSDGSLALFRISATAPSPEQIAKIYEDEKVLFQENAQATLYGDSDAVTALAYDDTTELLHVGTSEGRSDFQGLRRVNNTTNAVGAAISASNGMIVEE